VKVWKSASAVDQGSLPSAVAIGKFDGVHLGHQALIAELVSAAEVGGLTPVVLTFDRNPLAILSPETCPTPLIGQMQKAELLDSAGVQALLELEFTAELANLEAESFAIEYLVKALHSRIVLVGEGFRFGARGAGNVAMLRDLGKINGFEVREVAAVEFGGQRVSSSRIRALLQEGDVQLAASLLGHNHRTAGLVQHGRKLGRTIGFPTANLDRNSEGMLPGDGVYAGWLWVDGQRFPAAHSVGTNDSVGEVPRLVESHVIGRNDLDLYGRQVEVEYLQRVRGWSKFDSMDALVRQIADDVVQAEKILSQV